MSNFQINLAEQLGLDNVNVVVSQMHQGATAVNALGTGNITLTASALLGGVIDNDPGGAANWTVDTAANIVSGVITLKGSAKVGDYFVCHLHNNATASSGEVVTVTAGTGITLHGSTLTLTEGANVEGDLVIVLRNVTTGSQAVDVYVVTTPVASSGYAIGTFNLASGSFPAAGFGFTASRVKLHVNVRYTDGVDPIVSVLTGVYDGTTQLCAYYNIEPANTNGNAGTNTSKIIYDITDGGVVYLDVSATSLGTQVALTVNTNNTGVVPVVFYEAFQ